MSSVLKKADKLNFSLSLMTVMSGFQQIRIDSMLIILLKISSERFSKSGQFFLNFA